MKSFLIKIIIVLVASLISFEAILRIFNLSRFTFPLTVVDNNELYLPGNYGYYIGGGFGEIKAVYKINQQGWNSVLDYNEVEKESSKRVAVIGDSFIEGFQVDVTKSIGRQLDSLTKFQTITHEYGHSGANVFDFELVYEEYVKNNYDYVFVLISNGNLSAFSPSFMKNSNLHGGRNIMREVYSRSAILSYLNINHLMTQNLKNIFPKHFQSQGITPSGSFAENKWKSNIGFGPEVYYLFEPDKLDVESFKNAYHINPNRLIPIIHSKSEIIDFGFDSHWNLTGRRNCARTIYSVLSEDDLSL